MALQNGWFSDTYIKALGNAIALDMDDTTPGIFKGALFTGAVAGGTIDFDQTNPAYGSSPWNAGESSGPGYTAGGKGLTVASFGVLVGTANKVGWKLQNVLWPGTTITADGLLIYIPGLASRALMFCYFGQSYPTSDGDFEVGFHTDGAWREKLRAVA